MLKVSNVVSYAFHVWSQFFQFFARFSRSSNLGGNGTLEVKTCCVEFEVGAVLLLVVGGVVLLVLLLASIFGESFVVFLAKIDPNSTKRELNLAGLLAWKFKRPLLSPCNVLSSKQRRKRLRRFQSNSNSVFYSSTLAEAHGFC